MRSSQNSAKDVSDRNADLKSTNLNLNNKNDELKKQIEVLNIEKHKTIALLTGENQQIITKCSQLSLDVKKWKVNILKIT